MSRPLPALLLGPSLLLHLLCCAAVHAQADFNESFENLGANGQHGPAGLTARGWIFRNQSSQLSGAAAWTGPWPGGRPYEGSGYLRGTTSAVGGFVGQQMSQWAILPQIPNLRGGDTFTIWVLDGAHSVDTYLDIRYAPTGGTSTGSGWQGTGDFTQVLFTSELPVATGPYTYTPVEITLPGEAPLNGRLALRYWAPNMHSVGGVTGNLYLDEITIGGPVGPPCGLPVPAAGETIVWPGDATHTICQNIIVEEGATLEVGPGATINFTDNHELFVEGTLRLLGTPAAPIILNGDHVTGLRIYGSAHVEHAQIDAYVAVHQGGSLEAFDTLFEQQGYISAGSTNRFVRLERCEVAADVMSLGGSSVVTDVSLTNPAGQGIFYGFWKIDGLTSVAPLRFTALGQDRTIDNVTVSGIAAPALELHATGGNAEFYLGANNTITASQYPVWPRFCGLTPDSVVPLTGNTNNAILGVEHSLADLRSRISMPDLGVPYHFPHRGRVAGDAQIEPGAVLKFGPQGGFTIRGDNGTDGAIRGLPGNPIRFERLDPTQPWLSLATSPGWYLFEHLEVDGAGIGIVGNEAILFLSDSVITNCALGAQPAADGHMFGKGVEFYDNQVGLRNDTVNLAGSIGTGIHFSGEERPNIFEGNGLAAENIPNAFSGHYHEFPADHNWWGHATGPYEPLFHPQGQGDQISYGVQFDSFYNIRPDLSDTPPVVRLKTRLHPAVHPGEKIIIEWEASDDSALTGFDVQVINPDTSLDTPFFSFLHLGQNLPPDTRSFELVVPDVGLHPFERFIFRIVARDDGGNSSVEQFWLSIPHQRPSATVSFDLPPGEFRGGEAFTLCYDAINLSSSFPTFYVESAADDRMRMVASGPPGPDACTISQVDVPYASSDRIRIGLRAQGNFNRDEWYFTDYFTVRPDPRLGDAAPTIDVSSPLDGETFAGGGTIPIRWTAADDHGLREFRIQASFNGGYTFHTIETLLPPTQRSYDWRLPASTGIDDLRIRVVAVDTLMQNTSAADDRILRITPGAPPTCPADWDNSGGIDGDDIAAFFTDWQRGEADIDNSGGTDGDDIGVFFDHWQSGC